jgi:zinc protease
VAKRGLTAKVLVEPGAQTSVQMAWILPPDLELETKAKDKEDTLAKALGFAVLNRRLQVLTRSDDPPFIAGVAVQNDQEHAADITTLGATAQPGHWNEALIGARPGTAPHRPVRRAPGRAGPRDRQHARGFVVAAAGEATQRTTSLAGAIVGTLGDREIVTSPSQNLAAFDETKGLTADKRLGGC